MNKKGFIKSSKGQWAYPGKNTLIPNAKGRITMKGVNYPVLGIDDQGNQQLMLPQQEYQFPGNSVYEIPMAQKEGWLDQLQNGGTGNYSYSYEADTYKPDRYKLDTSLIKNRNYDQFQDIQTIALPASSDIKITKVVVPGTNVTLDIADEPGERFHSEPSFKYQGNRYYERDGKAYLVPQPKEGWKNKQTLDPSSGEWKEKIVKKQKGGWLDSLPKAQRGLSKRSSAKDSLLNRSAINKDNAVTLPEYTVKGKKSGWAKYLDENLDKEKQKYLNTQAYPGLVKGYGQNMENFPKDREDEIKNKLKWNYNTIEAEKIFKSIKADPNDRTSWIDKLDDNQKEIIKHSKYAYALSPSIWQSTAAGLGSIYNLHPLSNVTGKIKRTPGVTKKEFEDATVLDALEPLNYLGVVGANATAGLSEYGKYKDRPIFTGQHDPNRAYGSEELMNPLNWTLAADAAGLTIAGSKLGLKGLTKLNKFLKGTKAENIISQIPPNVPMNDDQIRNMLRNFQLHVNESDASYNQMPRRSDALIENTDGQLESMWYDDEDPAYLQMFNEPDDYDRYITEGDLADLERYENPFNTIDHRDTYRTSVQSQIDAIIDRFTSDPINNPFYNNLDPFTISTKPTNISGVTKEEALTLAPDHVKSDIENMPEEIFRKTVSKPNGEVVPYLMNAPVDIAENIYPMSNKEYVDLFNSRLDLLNDFIQKRNKNSKGLQYTVKGLTVDGKGDGKLHFTSDFGDSSFSVDIKPGAWRGEVKDVPNQEYYENLPGLNMRNTMQSVWRDVADLKGAGYNKEADKLLKERKGTGTYEAINDYLKALDMGRVKPGFNSQSEYSFPLWNNMIKKGKAHGYYRTKDLLYGALKTAIPTIGIPTIGVGVLKQPTPEQNEKGGSIKWLDSLK